MNYAIAQKSRLNLTDGRWLLVAVVVHALIFAIPLRNLPNTDLWHSAELVVRLISVQPRELPEETADEPVRVETPVWPKILKKIEIPQRDTTILEKTDPTAADPDPAQAQPEEEKNISAARLIEMQGSLTDLVPLDSESSQEQFHLGAPRTRQEPSNWKAYAGAEALAPFDNTFNGMTVPSETVVVDSWKEPGGARGMILETPSGHKLCGRSAPPDPMRPMITPIMNFHICGGDFRVPFKFKPREPLNRDFIDPVANDAIQLPLSPD